MDLPDLTSTDAVGVVFAWLCGPAAAEVAEIMGGPAESHVTGEIEPAWPHLVLTTGPGGDVGRLQWQTTQEVQLEVYGSPAGVPGEADLWKVALRLAQLVCDLPNRETEPGAAVVTDVEPSGTFAFQGDLPTGHPKWTIGVNVTLHPPLVT